MRYQPFASTKRSRTRVAVILGTLITGCVGVICIGSAITLFFFTDSRLPIGFGPTATPPSPNSAIAKALATPVPPRWKIYVQSVRERESSRSGWKYVTVDMAAQNVTNNPARFYGRFSYPGPGNMELVDTGGYARTGTCGGLERNVLIWPNFHVLFTCELSIPQNQSPVTMRLNIGGQEYVLSLQRPFSPITTSLGAAASSWKPKPLGQAIETPRFARVTLTGISFVDASKLSVGQYQGRTAIAIAMNIENTGGNDLASYDVLDDLFVFDDRGNLSEDFSPHSIYQLAPGKSAGIQRYAILPTDSKTSKTFWIVLCLKSGSDNCDIFQASMDHQISNTPIPTVVRLPTIAMPKYLVKPGDTLASIAAKYRVSTQAIMEANGLKGETLRVGQELLIPLPTPTPTK